MFNITIDHPEEFMSNPITSDLTIKSNAPSVTEEDLPLFSLIEKYMKKSIKLKSIIDKLEDLGENFSLEKFAETICEIDDTDTISDIMSYIYNRLVVDYDANASEMLRLTKAAVHNLDCETESFESDCNPEVVETTETGDEFTADISEDEKQCECEGSCETCTCDEKVKEEEAPAKKSKK